jgi:PAS domain S-box-containing protein
MRILLVEDNGDHRELMRLALTGHDLTWQVEGVASGEEALHCLAEGEAYDLVFLDYSLPERDGLGVLKEIRRGEAPPSVVMVTGRGDEGVAVEAMKRGAYDYVVKGEGYLQRLPVVAQRAVEAHQLAVDRKRAEEALRESEERYRRLVETAPEVIYSLSAGDGMIASLNPAFERITGWSRAEWLGKPFESLIHPDDLTLAMETFQQVLRGETPPSYELRILSKSGKYLIGEFKSVPNIEKGEVTGEFGIARDITERKRAEELLKKSEERFRTSVETLLEGFAILSAVRDSNGQLIDFKYEYINEAGCKMNQKPHEEHMGKTLLELLPTHKEIGLFDGYVRVVETGQSLTKEFLIYETVYGSGERLRQAFDVRITRLGDGFVTTWQDITDKKKGEELLRQSEERLRLLIENSKDVVIMADLEGSLIYYNGPPEYGITAEEALGKNPFSIFEPAIAARLTNQLKLVMKGGEALTFDNVIPWKGESFWFLTQMYPIRDEKGRMIAVGLIARNITERKRLEEILKKEQQELKLIIDSSPIILFYKDKEGKFIRVNKAFSEALKMHEEEFVGKTVFDLYPAKIAQGMTDDDQEVLKSGSPKLNIIEQYESASGIRWVQTDKIPICEKNCIPIGLIGFAQDITERKRMEEALRESEVRYRLLAENASDIIWTVNMNMQVTYISPSVTRLLGYTVEEAKSRTMEETYTPASFETARRAFEEEMALENARQGDPNRSRILELELTCKDGVVVPVEANFSFLRDAMGKPVGILSIARDITERKQAEEALRQAEENFRRSLDESPLGVRIVTTESETLYANRAILEIYGYDSIEELRTTPVKKRYTPESYAEFQIRKKKRQQGEYDPPEYEISIVRKNGEVRHLQVFRKEVLWNGEKQFQAIYLDITERRQAEEKIRTYQEQLRSLASELSSIEERERHHIATELHDNISQTLAITKIKLGMAQGLTSPTDWVGSLNEIGELIDQAIQYTRSLTFELSPPILYELGLEAALEWLAEQIQEKHGILANFEDDKEPKPLVNDVRVLLFQAVRELLINIVKHAQAHKVKISVRRENNNIKIIIEDDGVGFSTSEGRELGKTTGFGLFSIRERLKNFRGHLEVHSEPGKGTRVTLVAPLDQKEIHRVT